MTMDDKASNEHEKFDELAAMANLDMLSASEWAELQSHLRTCENCLEVYRQYRILAEEGFPALAADYKHAAASASWDHTAVRERLFAHMGTAEPQEFAARATQVPKRANILRPMLPSWLLPMAAAACVTVAVGFGGYYLRGRTDAGAKQGVVSEAVSAEDRAQKLTSEKRVLEDLLSAQGRKLTQLEAEGFQKQQQIEKLRLELQALQDRSNELARAKISSDEQSHTVSQQRDTLAERLRDAENAYQNVQAELANLRAERERTTLLLTSLDTRVNELSAINRDQELRLKNAEGFLSSDRDIRELMGARNLYIADVFDVDSSSRKRKPFGRIFYTQGKSLIFYAFDLDHQPGNKNAAFQVWGERDLPQGERALPVNLGILYVDSQTNRRWALRCDDPKQLAEIDAVFVTVEPLGGSLKPTSKAFLYALLRKEANHP